MELTKQLICKCFISGAPVHQMLPTACSLCIWILPVHSRLCLLVFTAGAFLWKRFTWRDTFDTTSYTVLSVIRCSGMLLVFIWVSRNCFFEINSKVSHRWDLKRGDGSGEFEKWVLKMLILLINRHYEEEEEQQNCCKCWNTGFTKLLISFLLTCNKTIHVETTVNKILRVTKTVVFFFKSVAEMSFKKKKKIKASNYWI